MKGIGFKITRFREREGERERVRSRITRRKLRRSSGMKDIYIYFHSQFCGGGASLYVPTIMGVVVMLRSAVRLFNR